MKTDVQSADQHLQSIVHTIILTNMIAKRKSYNMTLEGGIEKGHETYEITDKGRLQFSKARNITQLSNTFSRLYSTPQEYDAMRWRTRVDGKLKPLSVKFFEAQNNTPENIITEVTQIHKRTKFYVACSGGKDSICLAHYIEQNHPDKFQGLVFVDTGVGVKQTQEWLIKYCKEKNWKLHIEKAVLPKKLKSTETDVYSWFALHHGFPGPGMHNITMRILKYVTLRTFAFRQGRHDHAIISGTRKFESDRRAINTRPISKDGNFFFCSPFFNKQDSEVYKYLLENGLKKTPVHDILGMSGECMCGCYAKVGERELVKQLDPDLDAYFTSLEKRIPVEGTAKAKLSPIWGQGPVKQQKEKINASLEAYVCGEDCGGGTMRALENL